MEAFRRALLRLRGDKRELVLIVFEQLIKARLYKNRSGLLSALAAMSAAVVAWETERRTVEGFNAMEKIFALIYEARPLRQQVAYRRQVSQQNQEFGDRKAKIPDGHPKSPTCGHFKFLHLTSSR